MQHPIPIGTAVTHTTDKKSGKIVNYYTNVVYGAETTYDYEIDINSNDGGGRWNVPNSSFDNGDWVVGILV